VKGNIARGGRYLVRSFVASGVEVPTVVIVTAMVVAAAAVV
jgi:hypothetical protein